MDLMSRRPKLSGAAFAVAVGFATAAGVAAPPATSCGTTPWLWQRWSHVNTKYRHGVGKRFAHDHTSGTPVTNFYRSTLSTTAR